MCNTQKFVVTEPTQRGWRTSKLPQYKSLPPWNLKWDSSSVACSLKTQDWRFRERRSKRHLLWYHVI